MIINAKNHVLGRLASIVAQELLKGTQIKVTNANQLVITGNRREILHRFLERSRRGDPYKGPFYPKSPKGIFRRAVRGMLPKNKRGRKALKLLRVYNKVPKELEGKGQVVKDALVSESTRKYIILEEIENHLR